MINWKDCIVPIQHKEIQLQKCKRSNNGSPSDTLCWYCDRAYGDCTWSRKTNPIPVRGWNAIRNDTSYIRFNGEREYIESYVVLECPEFKIDELFKKQYHLFSIERCIRGIKKHSPTKKIEIYQSDQHNRFKKGYCKDGKSSGVSKSQLQSILLGFFEDAANEIEDT